MALSYKFYNRQRELEELKNEFNEKVIAQKECLTYLIQGRKDVGKTRIVSEFINAIDSDTRIRSEMPRFSSEKNVITYSCDKNKKESYQPFLKIKQEIEKQKKLLRFLNGIISVIMAIPVIGVNDLVEATKKLYRSMSNIPEKEITRRDKIKEFIKYKNFLYRKSKKTPFIIFIQNVQWIDTDSLNLIERLISSESSLWGMVILEEDTTDEYNEEVQKNLNTMISNELIKTLIILGMDKGFPSRLLESRFGSNFFSDEENDILYVISEGCPGKLLHFIEDCFEEEWLYEKNSKLYKVEEFQQRIKPIYQKLLELIIQALEDEIITEGEKEIIYQFSKGWGMTRELVSDTICMVKDISKAGYKILNNLGPGIISKISFLADKNNRRYIVEHLQIKKSIDGLEFEHREIFHKNLWEAKEIQICEEGLLIVWDFLEGIRTRDVLSAANEILISKNVNKIIQIVEGLSELHKKGLAHGYIKPEAIFETESGVYRLASFNSNLLKILASENITKDPEHLKFLSPEQLEGEEVDIRSDIYSIGILFYNSVTDRFPFQGTTREELKHSIERNQIPFSSNLIAFIPEDYQKIIKKCVEYNPNNRYQNANELLTELKSLGKVSPTYARIDDKEEIPKDLKEEIKTYVKEIDDDEKIQSLIKSKYQTIISVSIINKLRMNIKGRWKKVVVLSFIILAAAALASYYWRDTFIIEEYKKTEVINVMSISLDPNFDENISKPISPTMISYLIADDLSQSSDEVVLSSHDFKRLYPAKDTINYVPHIEIDGEIRNQLNQYVLELNVKNNNAMTKIDTSFGFIDPSRLLSEIVRDVTELLIVDSLKKSTFTEDWDAFEAFYEGDTAWAKLNITKAEEKFKESLNIDPKFVLAKLRLTSVYRWRGNTTDAQSLLQEIRPRLNELSKVDSLRAEVITHQLKGDLRTAIRIAKNIIQLQPANKEAPYQVAELYYQYCDIEKAMEYYNKALDHDPNFSPAINHLAYCFTHKGGYETDAATGMSAHNKALNLFKKYVELDNSANSYDSWGDGFLGSGKLDSAEWAKKEGIKLDPELNYLYSSLSYINIRQGKINEAIENSDRYLEKSGSSKQSKVTSYLIKALSFYARDEFDSALDTCLAALNILDPKDLVTRNHEIHWLLGILYLQTDQLDSAKNILDEMNEIIVNNEINNINYHKIYKYKLHLEALISANMNNYARINEILYEFDNQLKFRIKNQGSPFGPAFFNNSFGEMFIKLGQPTKAEKRLQLALEYNPNYALAHYQLWQLYRSQNNSDLAEEHLEKFEKQWMNADDDIKIFYNII